MNEKFYNITFYFLLAVLISSCASEVAPTGGPKDEQPPVIVKSDPQNLTTNFNSETIEITFDEFFQLNNYKQKMLISPPFTENPTFTVKGKKLIIKFKEPLIPNSTYKIFLNDAIADYNEGNPYLNFSYVFSTGNLVDSSTIKGFLKDALTHAPVDGAMIYLYDDLSDSAFTTSKPYYLTKTDKEGFFCLDYLKDTLYNIFAIKENDNSMTYNLVTESIAFYDSVISPRDTNSLNLWFFSQTDTVQQVIDEETSLNKAIFMLKFPPSSPEIVFYNKIPSYYNIVFNPTKDTITILTQHVDTLSLIVFDNNSYIDSLQFVVSSEKMIEKSKFTISNDGGNKLFYEDTLKLNFNNLVKEFLVDSAMFIISKDTITDTLYNKLIYCESDNHAIFKHTLQQKSKYTIIIPDSAIVDINDHYNQLFKWSFDITDEDDFGGIVLKLTQDSTKQSSSDVSKQKLFLIQILDSKGNVTSVDRSVSLNRGDTATLIYKLLHPATYVFRIVEDLNGDGRWTSGDFAKRRQPEMTLLSKTIEVKSRWDVEETITIPLSLSSTTQDKNH